MGHFIIGPFVIWDVSVCDVYHVFILHFFIGQIVRYCRSFKASNSPALFISHLPSQAKFCWRHYSLLIISLWLEIGRELWVSIVLYAGACSAL